MAAPAAPAAGEAGYLLIGLGVLCLYLTLYGLDRGYAYSLGALLTWLARLTGHIWIVGGKLADAIEAVNHEVRDTLASGLAATETVIGKWWHGQEWIVRQLADALDSFASDTYTTVYNLATSTIPNAAQRAARQPTQDLAAFRRATTATINAELARFARGIDALRVDVSAEALARLRGIDALRRETVGRLTAQADALRADVAAAERYARHTLSRRIGKVEAALGAGVIGAAALATMARVMPWYRCTNVGRFNRALCRADVAALDDLLAATLVIVGSVSIVELARELQAVTGVAADAVDGFIREA